MKVRARKAHVEELPRRDVLETLARHYHQLQNEHKRAGLESGVRRRIEDQLLDVRERFDRLLVEWVPDPAASASVARASAQPRPGAGWPAWDPSASLSRQVGGGRSGRGPWESGDELKVEIDGSLIARIVGEKDFAADIPSFRWHFDGVDVSNEALGALADFLRNDESPPWEHAAEVLADGLIDANAALTPRGRRALSRRQ